MGREIDGNKQRQGALLVSLTILIIAVVVLRNAWVSDDAYVSFRTVDNFVHGLGLRWNGDERVQGFTNPLWVLFMAPFHLLTGEMYFTSIFVSIAVTVVMLILLVRRLSVDERSAVLALAILFFSKAFVDFSTSGLENPMTNLLLVLFLTVFFTWQSSPRTFFWLCFVVALGAVNRMDTVLLCGPLLVYAFVHLPWRKGLRAGLAGFSPFILWELFAIVYYGFPFPNTYYAKLRSGLPEAEFLKQGVAYFMDILAADPIVLLTICASVVAVAHRRRRGEWPVVAGIVLYLGYVLWIGGDFMSGRFFVGPLVCSVGLIARTRLPKRTGAFLAPLAMVTLVGVFSPNPPIATGIDFGRGPEGSINVKGIADERGWYFQTTSLIGLTRDAREPRHSWAQVGADIRHLGIRVTTTGTVGFEGYFAGPQVHIIDLCALNDALMARLPCDQRRGWRIGHLIRVVPEGYTATLNSGDNHIADSSLARYYDALKVVTRDKIWTLNRFRLIWRLNTGAYDSLLNKYAHPPATVVRYARICEPRGQGTPWNAEDCFVIRPPEGIVIELDSTVHVPQVEMSLDHNDKYQIVFYHDSTELGWFGSRLKTVAGGGLRVDTLCLPRSVTAGGYNRIQIYPWTGDDMFSVGHVRLMAGE